MYLQNKLFTDASLRKNIGIGGYCKKSLLYSCRVNGKKDVNRAELASIYVGLLLCNCKTIEIVSDSATAIELISGKFEKSKYQTLVDCINYITLVKFSKVKYTKVKAHSGVFGNEVADCLAYAGSESDRIFHMPDLIDEKYSIKDLVYENIYRNSFDHNIIFS